MDLNASGFVNHQQSFPDHNKRKFEQPPQNNDFHHQHQQQQQSNEFEEGQIMNDQNSNHGTFEFDEAQANKKPKLFHTESSDNLMRGGWGINQSRHDLKWMPSWLKEQEKQADKELQSLQSKALEIEKFQKSAELDLEKEIEKRKIYLDDYQVVDVTGLSDGKALLIGDGWHFDSEQQKRVANLFYKFTPEKIKPQDPRLVVNSLQTQTTNNNQNQVNNNAENANNSNNNNNNNNSTSTSSTTT